MDSDQLAKELKHLVFAVLETSPTSVPALEDLAQLWKGGEAQGMPAWVFWLG